MKEEEVQMEGSHLTLIGGVPTVYRESASVNAN